MWPTATTQDNQQVAGQYATNGTTLAGAALQMWLTPRANEPGEGNETFVKRMGDRGEHCHGSLGSQARKWPTPTAGDSKASGSRDAPGSKAHGGMSLTDAATTGDSRGRVHRGPEPTGPASPSGATRRRLNPTFVEWLMGVPLGWTASECSATAWTRWWALMRSALLHGERG